MDNSTVVGATNHDSYFRSNEKIKKKTLVRTRKTAEKPFFFILFNLQGPLNQGPLNQGPLNQGPPGTRKLQAKVTKVTGESYESHKRRGENRE